MSINFPLILVILVFLGAAIWFVDALFFKSRRPEEEKEPILVENAKSLTPILFIVLFVRSFLIEPFQIPSGSMIPTLLIGDFILVNKYAYGVRLPVWRKKIIDVGEPQRGDVMVFFPPHRDEYFIKRVVGLPGDHIEYREQTLYINGEEAPQELIAALPPGRPTYELRKEKLGDVVHDIRLDRLRRLGGGVYLVPEGQYFMVGDNRDQSQDSRSWGMVPEERIVGKAFAIWMHKNPGWNLPTFTRAGGFD